MHDRDCPVRQVRNDLLEQFPGQLILTVSEDKSGRFTKETIKSRESTIAIPTGISESSLWA